MKRGQHKTLQEAIQAGIDSKVQTYKYLRDDGISHDAAIARILGSTSFGPDAIKAILAAIAKL